MGKSNKSAVTKAWILRSFTSELPDHEKRELLDWIESDPENLREYHRIRNIWEQSESKLSGNPDELNASWNHFLGTVRTEPVRRHKLGWYLVRVAASLALLAGITATLVWLIPDKDPASLMSSVPEPEQSYIITPEGNKVILAADQTEIRLDSLAVAVPEIAGHAGDELAQPAIMELVVPRSRRVSIVLADGSRIWLNSESRLKYPATFTGQTRSVALEGEALFQVAHEESRPFIVETSSLNIRVLGTTFNIAAYRNEPQISTTLVEGSVEINEKDGTGSHLLCPNERAVYTEADRSFSITETDTELYTSWIHGYLKFNSESLDVVIQKLERSYGIALEINDTALKAYQFSGKLDLQETVYQVLNVIQLVAPLEYREQNGKILILNKSE